MPPTPSRTLRYRSNATLASTITSHQCGAARAASAHGTASKAHKANSCQASAPLW